MKKNRNKPFVICIICILTSLGITGCLEPEAVGESRMPQVTVAVTELPKLQEELQNTEAPQFSIDSTKPQPNEAPHANAQALVDEEKINWFAAYNGNKLQRITEEDPDAYSPALCSDIIFYEAEENETLEEIMNKMIDAMIQPLMEPSEDRPFTITEYRLEEQEYYLYDENIPGVWLLPYLNGYYSYAGTDFVAMETVMEAEPAVVKEGMVPFLRQGNEEAFVFVLMQEGNVYRLQRMQDMEILYLEHQE